MSIPKDVLKFLRTLQPAELPGERKIIESKEPKQLVIVCSGANGCSRRNLGICLTYWDGVKEETIAVFGGNFPSMLWKWDPFKWAWFACSVIKRGNINNVSSVTFSYKLQKCPNTKEFHAQIDPYFRSIWEKKFQSYCNFKTPCLKYDTCQEEDLTILFDTKIAPDDIENRRKCPAFSYRYGGPDSGDQFNTNLEVIDSNGKYFPSIKSYLEFRFRKTSLDQLTESEVQSKVDYSLAKLRIEKKRQGNGFHDALNADREHEKKRLKRMRQLAQKYGEEVPKEAQNACEVCGIRDGEERQGVRIFNQKCGECGEVWYCCREHQKIDWRRGHKKVCKKLKKEKEDFAELDRMFGNMMS